MRPFPDYYLESVHDIDLSKLKALGKTNVLLDLDNTILSREEDEISPQMKAWIAHLQAEGFTICLLSNNWAKRLQELAGDLDIAIVSKAVKPLPFAFLHALRKIGARASDTVMIGDQLFTDVLGARFLTIMTIMVLPLSEQDLKHTLMLRKAEKLIMKDRQTEEM